MKIKSHVIFCHFSSTLSQDKNFWRRGFGIFFVERFHIALVNGSKCGDIQYDIINTFSKYFVELNHSSQIMVYIITSHNIV